MFLEAVNTPLENLVAIAPGDMATSAHAVTGDVVLMFIELANEVVEMINSHPYYSGTTIQYNSQTDFQSRTLLWFEDYSRRTAGK